MHIPIILGTAREGRMSEKVSDYLLKRIETAGATTELVDVRDFRLPATDNTEENDQARTLIKIVESADAFVLVLPEYNHGYPGELKMMLDLAYRQYDGKRVLLAGVSSGGLGGARAVENILPVLVALGMQPTRTALYFSRVNGLFDDNGNINDPSYDDRSAKALKQLI
jgi:NAD(P)H-dependent FMN reductase